MFYIVSILTIIYCNLLLRPVVYCLILVFWGKERTWHTEISFIYLNLLSVTLISSTASKFINSISVQMYDRHLILFSFKLSIVWKIISFNYFGVHRREEIGVFLFFGWFSLPFNSRRFFFGGGGDTYNMPGIVLGAWGLGVGHGG